MKMNSVNIIGNLVKDIELKGQEGNVASFMVAVQRPFKDKQTGEYESDFIPCIAFGNTATILAKHFSKGNKIGISGRWQSGNYENKQGQKVYTNDLVVRDITFVEKKGQSNAPAPKQQANDPFANSAPDVDSDSLPF